MDQWEQGIERQQQHRYMTEGKTTQPMTNPMLFQAKRCQFKVNDRRVDTVLHRENNVYTLYKFTCTDNGLLCDHRQREQKIVIYRLEWVLITFFLAYF